MLECQGLRLYQRNFIWWRSDAFRVKLFSTSNAKHQREVACKLRGIFGPRVLMECFNASTLRRGALSGNVKPCCFPMIRLSTGGLHDRCCCMLGGSFAVNRPTVSGGIFSSTESSMLARISRKYSSPFTIARRANWKLLVRRRCILSEFPFSLINDSLLAYAWLAY